MRNLLEISQFIIEKLAETKITKKYRCKVHLIKCQMKSLEKKNFMQMNKELLRGYQNVNTLKKTVT